MSEPHRWRSPLLGDLVELDLPQGHLEAHRRGEGRALVFSHGWLSNANLWREVIDRLAGSFACIALDLPLGAHRVPMPDADLAPEGCAGLISAALEALDLDGATLVGNDSGGAYSQIATAACPERVARLVLNACETPYDDWPPPPFDGLPAAAGDPRELGELLAALEDPEVRKAPAAFGLLAKRPLNAAASDSYALPCVVDEAVVADVARVMAATEPGSHHAAGTTLVESFAGEVLCAWPEEDRVFSVENARRYAAELKHGELELIPDSFSFTPEDNPDALSEAIARFAR